MPGLPSEMHVPLVFHFVPISVAESEKTQTRHIPCASGFRKQAFAQSLVTE